MNRTDNVLAFDLATTGLNLLQDRIVAIYCKTETDEFIFTGNERLLLVRFWMLVRSKGFEKIIGFNINYYDLLLLLIRSMKYKIAIYDIRDKVVDMRHIYLNGQVFNKGKLSDFEKLLGINYPDSPYCKSDVQRLNGYCPPDLKEFLLRDVKSTWIMYEHARASGVI
jgi:DNA polymerase elongation subunit (family B)